MDLPGKRRQLCGFQCRVYAVSCECSSSLCFLLTCAPHVHGARTKGKACAWLGRHRAKHANTETTQVSLRWPGPGSWKGPVGSVVSCALIQ